MEFSQSTSKNNRKTLNKILFRIKKLKKKDNKVTLVTLKFSMREYEKIRNGHRLTTTTQDLLHLMYEFGKLHKINDVVTVHLVDDQLQKIETDTCGIFQLYFYVNLFTPLENSSIVNDKKLSKSTLEKLLNEISYLDRDKNKCLVEQSAEEKDIPRGSSKNKSCRCLLINNLRLSKIVDLNRHSITFMMEAR